MPRVMKSVCGLVPHSSLRLRAYGAVELYALWCCAPAQRLVHEVLLRGRIGLVRWSYA